MTILISPTEPPGIGLLGVRSPLPEQYGCDLLIPGTGFMVGVQRKKFPDDFAASLNDGRFTKFAAQMSAVDFALVVLEGVPTWTNEGVLISDHHRLTKRQVWGVQWSLQLKDIGTIWTTGIPGTRELVESLRAWAQKPSHRSLDRRPNPHNAWGSARSHDWQRHLLQGFPGIGPELADRIIDQAGGVPLTWTMTASELARIDGLGPKRIAQLMKALGTEE